MTSRRILLLPIYPLALSACISLNPTPNNQGYGLTDVEAKAARMNAMETEMMDRESRKAQMRDEAEVRAWEKNISRPDVPSYGYGGYGSSRDRYR